MKVKFSHVFKDHEQKEIALSKKEGDVATLKKITVDVLMYPTTKEMETMGASEKCRRHDLAVKVINFGDEAELTAEDVSLLKKLIGERYIPVVVAHSFAILDGKELPQYNIQG